MAKPTYVVSQHACLQPYAERCHTLFRLFGHPNIEDATAVWAASDHPQHILSPPIKIHHPSCHPVLERRAGEGAEWPPGPGWWPYFGGWLQVILVWMWYVISSCLMLYFTKTLNVVSFIIFSFLNISRSDSPGHCAKYGSYSLIEERLNKVLDVQLVQVRLIKTWSRWRGSGTMYSMCVIPCPITQCSYVFFTSFTLPFYSAHFFLCYATEFWGA